MSTGRYRPYPGYKSSGVEWLEEIPSHWSTQKLRNLGAFSASGIDKKIVPGEPLVDIVNYTDVYGNKTGLIEADREFMRVSCPESKLKEHQIQRGDLLFTPSSETIEDIGVSCLVNADRTNTSFSYHLVRLKFSAELDHGFKKYLCNNEYILNQFSQAARGTTRQTLGRDDFKATVVPFPPLPEQTQIAKFLDHETAKIDRLIEKQEALIRLLKEKRQAVISHAVTKGLNPHAPLKDSGIEWLGQVPAHWVVTTVRNLVRAGDLEIQDGNHGELHPVAAEYVDEGIPFLMANNVREGKADLTDCSFITIQRATKLRIGFAKPKDILLTHKGTVGEVAIVPDQIEEPFWMLTPQVTYYRFADDKYHRAFYYRLFQSGFFQEQLELIGAKQSTRAYVGLIAQGDLLVTIPPHGEQVEIARHLAPISQRLETMIASALGAITLLQERRTALISAAVTGKIDVRHWQPPASEVST